MKKSNDVVISTEVRTINVEATEVENILNEFTKRRVKTTVPKGYYTLKEYAKMAKISVYSAREILNKMLKEGKVSKKTFTNYTDKGTHNQIVYYKME